MIVTLRGLAKRFAHDEVLADVDLDLGPGSINAVIGLNGAGKTTLLRCLAGVLTPSRGTISWDGNGSIRDDMALHRHMIFLPDAPLVLEDRSIIDHIVLHLRAYARDEDIDDGAIIDMLHELDLTGCAASALGQLSRGQRYKASLAALLLIRPQLWLLDEPFASGMDPQGMLVLKNHARRAAAAGSCVVYTTQILEIAERFCDALLVIDHGRIAHRFRGDELRMMPTDGPGSLGDRLTTFRGSP